MSEFIDNVEQSPRVRALLEFATRVLDGGDISALAPEYETAIEAVEPYDVLVIEDELLADGVSVPAIKEGMPPILETLRPALEAYDWDRPDRGHPIDNLLGEHQAIESHLESLGPLVDEIATSSTPPLDAVSELQDHVSALAGIDRQFVRKENVLFPHTEGHWKHDRPLGVMWSIHDDIRSIRSTIEDLSSDPDTNPETLSTLVSRLQTMVRGLQLKDEFVVFPVAKETLGETEWAQIQRESAEIGYFEIEPGFGFLETGSDAASANQAQDGSARTDVSSNAVALGLDTGTLDPDEIQRLLDTIPLDVTYVDENDRVRYFNNPEDRIFPRSGSIIGRTVQHCHPPESVDTVEEILEAFRSGSQDSARFWIQTDEDFVVIDYRALRDESGTYRGTLEITREVSDLRELTGEQRLIEWGN